MGAIDYKRSGCPDLGVGTSRFEPTSGPAGPRVVEVLFIAYQGV
jgi:hypothetical protein